MYFLQQAKEHVDPSCGLILSPLLDNVPELWLTVSEVAFHECLGSLFLELSLLLSLGFPKVGLSQGFGSGCLPPFLHKLVPGNLLSLGQEPFPEGSTAVLHHGRAGTSGRAGRAGVAGMATGRAGATRVSSFILRLSSLHFRTRKQLLIVDTIPMIIKKNISSLFIYLNGHNVYSTPLIHPEVNVLSLTCHTLAPFLLPVVATLVAE